MVAYNPSPAPIYLLMFLFVNLQYIQSIKIAKKILTLIPKWDLGFSFRYQNWVLVIDYPRNPQQTLNKPNQQEQESGD